MHARVVVALLLITVPAAAHEEHETSCDRRAEAWAHLDLWDLELGPGETAQRTLAFEGCPFEADWLVLMRGDVEGRVDISVEQDNETVEAFSWSEDGFVTFRLAHTDRMRIQAHNPTETNSSLRMYYDQTCLCPVKGTHLVPGPVWMNALAQEGDQVSFEVAVAPTSFPKQPDLPETVHVRALHVDDPLLEQNWTLHPRQDPPCREGTTWSGCITYTFTAPVDGRQDVLVWLDHDGGDGWSVSLRPVIEVDAPEAEASGPWFVASLCAVAVAMVLRRR